MKISFHGADQGVTGSCHLVECAGQRILIDCGMYQGGRELVEENAEPMGFDPASIDFLLLTHAHLGHCGLIAPHHGSPVYGPTHGNAQQKAPMLKHTLVPKAPRRSATIAPPCALEPDGWNCA